MERWFFRAKSFGTNQTKPRIKKEKKKVTYVRVQENRCAKKGWFLHPEQEFLTAGVTGATTGEEEKEHEQQRGGGGSFS